MSLAEIAECVNRSKATVRYWLRRFGLRTQLSRGGPPRAGVREARESGLRELLLNCPRHGATQHLLDARGCYRCRRCRRDAVVRRRRKVKRLLVRESGGRCAICGYDRCLAALEFHHVDPRTKDFGMAAKGMARSIERLRAEARKCILLCSNCHAEVESGLASISGVAQLHGPG
jgi:hypothetical protein